MKILLSAYACAPHKGSEPGVGWNWAVELANAGHDVSVITRAENRDAIEKGIPRDVRDRLSFLYYDLAPLWQWESIARIWRFRFGLHFFWHVWHYPYHFFWQRGALRAVRKIHTHRPFDLVHHVTFATIRRSSFLGQLGIPFIFGPVGGGERAPWRLRLAFGLKNAIFETVRDISVWATKFNPGLRATCRSATRIYATTPESLAMVPKSERYKAKVKLQLGLEVLPGRQFVASPRRRPLGAPLRLLYVGRFLYWKGMALGLQAVAKLIQEMPETQLTMVGAGPEMERWRTLSTKLGIASAVSWLPWMERNQLEKIYSEHDVFIFPSLHDSGGLVVIEAMAQGLPVVCLNLGGPGVSVTESSGISIDAKSRSASEIVNDLHSALRALARDEPRRFMLGCGALQRAQEFTWPKLVEDVYATETVKREPAAVLRL